MQQDEYGIYDIYTFIHLPFWETVFFKRFFLFLVVLGIIFLVWQGLKIFFLRKKAQNIPVRSTVLTLLDDVRKEQNVSVVYSNMSLILRLFFTDTHRVDMISLTEHEMMHHIDSCTLCNELKGMDVIDHCVTCKANSLLLYNWKKEIKSILEKISSIKYEAEQLLPKEAIISDINMVTILVHSVYFKK